MKRKVVKNVSDIKEKDLYNKIYSVINEIRLIDELERKVSNDVYYTSNEDKEKHSSIIKKLKNKKKRLENLLYNLLSVLSNNVDDNVTTFDDDYNDDMPF